MDMHIQMLHGNYFVHLAGSCNEAMHSSNVQYPPINLGARMNLGSSLQVPRCMN